MFLMLHAEIFSAKTMAEAKRIVHEKVSDQKNTLVLLDVDMTLVFPDNQAVRYPAIKRNLLTYYRIQWSKGYLTRTLVTVLYPPVLIESDIPQLIQEFGSKTILFTACASGAVGPFQSIKKTKYEGLKKLGIDFSKTFGKDFEDPVFYKGMLFAENEDRKGEVLVQFLKKISLTKLKTIVLIDDRKSNIKDVMKTLNTQMPDIQFVGIEYQGSLDKGGDISSEEFKRVWRHAADIAHAPQSAQQ